MKKQFYCFLHQAEFTRKRGWRCSANNVSARIYFCWRKDSSGTTRDAKTWRGTEVCM